jgi:hypothetical protein
VLDERIAAAIQERVREGTLRCAAAFHIAEELGVTPQAVGKAADDLDVRLVRCQLGLFGHGEQGKIVEPALEVSAQLEQAIREELADGRLSCAAAWAIAARFKMPKLHVTNAAEGLQIRIGPCQLGAF